jgi:hypothetical protein
MVLSRRETFMGRWMLAVFISVPTVFPGIDSLVARPRAFTVWDNGTGQWANPNAEDLTEDVSPLRSVQSTPDILPTFRKSLAAKISNPSRTLPTSAKPPAAAAKGGTAAQYSVRRIAP